MYGTRQSKRTKQTKAIDSWDDNFIDVMERYEYNEDDATLKHRKISKSSKEVTGEKSKSGKGCNKVRLTDLSIYLSQKTNDLLKPATNDRMNLKEKSNLHKIIYKIKLVAIFLKTAINKDYTFLWNSNMSKLNYADETLSNFVVQLPNKNKYRIICVKYKEDMNATITDHDFFSGDGEFSVLKYFKSFCKANPIFNTDFSENLDNLEDFVVIANVNSDLKKFDTIDLTEEDEFLFMKNGAKVSTFNQKGHSAIENSMEYYPKDCEKYIAQFLEKFKIVSNYSSEIELENWIDEKLEEPFHLLDANLISSILAKQSDSFNDIFANNKSITPKLFTPMDKRRRHYFTKIIHKINNLMHCEISRDYLCELKSCGVEFETKIKWLPDKRLILLSTICPQLSTIKILQNYDGWNSIEKPDFFKKVDFIFVQSHKLKYSYKVERIIRNSFDSAHGPNILVIECIEIDEDDFDYIMDMCIEWLSKNNSKKKIVLILEKLALSEFFIQEDDNICRISDDDIWFKHLKDEAKQKFRNEERFSINRIFH